MIESTVKTTELATAKPVTIDSLPENKARPRRRVVLGKSNARLIEESSSSPLSCGSTPKKRTLDLGVDVSNETISPLKKQKTDKNSYASIRKKWHTNRNLRLLKNDVTSNNGIETEEKSEWIVYTKAGNVNTTALLEQLASRLNLDTKNEGLFSIVMNVQWRFISVGKGDALSYLVDVLTDFYHYLNLNWTNWADKNDIDKKFTFFCQIKNIAREHLIDAKMSKRERALNSLSRLLLTGKVFQINSPVVATIFYKGELHIAVNVLKGPEAIASLKQIMKSRVQRLKRLSVKLEEAMQAHSPSSKPVDDSSAKKVDSDQKAEKKEEVTSQKNTQVEFREGSVEKDKLKLRKKEIKKICNDEVNNKNSVFSAEKIGHIISDDSQLRFKSKQERVEQDLKNVLTTSIISTDKNIHMHLYPKEDFSRVIHAEQRIVAVIASDSLYLKIADQITSKSVEGMTGQTLKGLFDGPIGLSMLCCMNCTHTVRFFEMEACTTGTQNFAYPGGAITVDVINVIYSEVEKRIKNSKWEENEKKKAISLLDKVIPSTLYRLPDTRLCLLFRMQTPSSIDSIAEHVHKKTYDTEHHLTAAYVYVRGVKPVDDQIYYINQTNGTSLLLLSNQKGKCTDFFKKLNMVQIKADDFRIINVNVGGKKKNVIGYRGISGTFFQPNRQSTEPEPRQKNELDIIQEITGHKHGLILPTAITQLFGDDSPVSPISQPSEEKEETSGQSSLSM